MRVSQKLVMLCAAISVWTALPATAGEMENDIDIGNAMKSGEIMPLEEIIQRATSQYPGKITEIELGSSEGRYMYEIDVVDEGGVKRELKLDAKTAELLSSEVDEDDSSEVATAESPDENAAAQEEDDDDND
jgi:hypothetical protein